MKKALLFFGILFLSFSSFAQDITGDWYGVLDVGMAQLPLVLHIKQDDSGYSASLDSPDQNAKGIPVTEIHFKDDTLTLDLSNLQAKYIGKFDSETNTFDGDFTQKGQTLPLNLSQKKLEAPKRPQTPKKPYPYKSEEVTFHNTKQDVTLAGTLTLPEKGENFPAVILITGSGPQNRDEELLGHKPFLVISDYLTRNGIAVLRYDDRGVGESTGTFAGSTTADFATDANAAFQYLKSHREINTKEIGLLGHSEGGLIAPIVAAKNKKVDFIVLLAGPGVNGGKVLLKQQEIIGKARGKSDEMLHQTKEINQKTYAIIRDTKDTTELKQKIREYIKEALNKYPELKDNGESDEEIINKQVRTYMNPWMRYFISYSPTKALQNVTCPVLALDGSHDLQVDADQNLPAIKKALEEGGNTHVTTMKLEGLNHLFQESKTGNPNEYQKIEKTISPKVLGLVKDWILDI